MPADYETKIASDVRLSEGPTEYSSNDAIDDYRLNCLPSLENC